jgi:uncharacterized protein YjbI with pentapeptide repeats
MPMNESFFEKQKFERIDYSQKKIVKANYENCTFINCNFASTDLLDINFVECEFRNCNLSLANIANTTFRDVTTWCISPPTKIISGSIPLRRA